LRLKKAKSEGFGEETPDIPSSMQGIRKNTYNSCSDPQWFLAFDYSTRRHGLTLPVRNFVRIGECFPAYLSLRCFSSKEFLDEFA
jgi:hypothetical protein